MKDNKRVDKTSRTKDQPQERSKGGGRLDGKAATTNSKRDAKGSVRNK